MAQISYGTITITDTNDIESIVVEYARNQSTSSAPDSQTGGWSTTRPAWAQGYYIWQRTRIHKSGTDTSEDEFGTAVCITGSTGQTGVAGRSLTATETKYTNVASGTTQTQVEALAESVWVSNVPSYDSSKPDYWIRVKNTYDKTPTTEYIYYKDNATGESLYNSAMANSIAQHANEDAQGAMSQAAAAQQLATQIDTLLGGHFIYGGTLSQQTPGGARIVETITNSQGIDVTGIPSQWGYNVTIGSNGIKLRNNENDLSSWTNTGLTFYNPSTNGQGTRAMTLDGSNLTFYGSDGETVQAVFGGTGASVKGAITATSLTISSNGDSYNAWDAINVTGYSIEIETTEITGSTTTKKLTPHLYHNGANADIEVTDWTKFIWYRDAESTGITGSSTDGSITGYYGSTYKVTYRFEDGAVSGGTEITTITVQPTDYITDINNSGIKIHPKNHTTGNYIQLDGTGMEVFEIGQTDVSIASFGASGSRIGKITEAHTVIDEDGMQIYSVDGNNNLVQLANIGYGEGQAQSGTAIAPYYTFGTRAADSVIGNFSVAEGYNTIASKAYSHAEGFITNANGIHSHAEGTRTMTSNAGAHAEGYGYSPTAQIIASGMGAHAEGSAYNRNIVASGHGSHAEGEDTVAQGMASHAGGTGTTATTRSQTVIGEYNELDTGATGTPSGNRGSYAFVIGNGTTDNARSNAFTVDWSGNLWTAGSLKTNRSVLYNGTTITLANLASASVQFGSFTLQPNTTYLLLSNIVTNSGSSMTLLNDFSFNSTNNLIFNYGGYSRVTTTSGHGLNNWRVVRTNANSVVVTLTGYNYAGTSTNYSQTGRMVGIPL